MKKFLLSLVVLVIILAVGYSAGIGYYAEKFQANTRYGSIDISNLTLPEAQERLEEEIMKQTVTITENGNEIGTLTIGDLNPEINAEIPLTQTYDGQNPNNWIVNYFTTNEYDNNLAENISIDGATLRQKLNEIGLDNSGRQASMDAEIDYNPTEGYHIRDAQTGNQIDFGELESLIAEQIQMGSDVVEINQAYIPPQVFSDDEDINYFMDQIEAATNVEITLEIAGNEEVITSDQIEEWLYFDASNQIVYDEVAIHEYLGTLNDKYATFNKPRQFQSTLEGEVTVEPGTLGWSINRESETQSIINDLHGGVDVRRQPTIDGTGYNTEGTDDIGNSYIEVSMDAQHMWVYVDGVVVVETPIVTGQIGTDTIPGAYSIWDKEEDSELTGFNARTGRDYVQPVEYWIPFDDTGQGIHDANWQSNFGGDTYLVSGSLGCINTPPGIMPQVFAHAQLGMPVIVH